MLLSTKSFSLLSLCHLVSVFLSSFACSMYVYFVFLSFSAYLSRDSGPSSIVAEPERFDADPDPTFQADLDPDPDPKIFSWGKKQFSFKIFTYSFQNLTKLDFVIFSITMREEVCWVMDKEQGMRKEG